MYIDPNTGGVIFQALAIAFTAISGLVFAFSGQIKLMIAQWRRKGREDAEQVEDQAE